MSAEERRQKFSELSSDLIGEERKKMIEQKVFELEKLKDVSELMSLVVRQDL